MTEHSTRIDDLSIFYTTAGNPNSQPAVFLHGRGARKGRFFLGIDPVISNLAKDFYVVAPEHPGLNRSQTPEKNWNFDDYAKVYHRLFSKLDLDKLLLIGNSFGGAIATAYAKLFPKNVQALILVDSVVSSDYPETQTVLNMDRNILRILESKFAPLLLKKVTVWNALGTPMGLLDEKEIQRKIKFIKNAWKLNIDYAKLQVPTTLIWGKNDIKIHPIKYARDIVKKNPEIKLVEYTGDVGTIYQDPQKVIGLIREIFNG